MLVELSLPDCQAQILKSRSGKIHSPSQVQVSCRKATVAHAKFGFCICFPMTARLPWCMSQWPASLEVTRSPTDHLKQEEPRQKALPAKQPHSMFMYCWVITTFRTQRSCHLRKLHIILAHLHMHVSPSIWHCLLGSELPAKPSKDACLPLTLGKRSSIVIVVQTHLELTLWVSKVNHMWVHAPTHQARKGLDVKTIQPIQNLKQRIGSSLWLGNSKRHFTGPCYKSGAAFE